MYFVCNTTMPTVESTSKTVSDNLPDELTDVLKNAKEDSDTLLKEKVNSKSHNTKVEVPKNYCKCAVKFQTKDAARNAIEDGREVILVMIEETTIRKKDGEKIVKQVQRPFSRCRKTAKEGSNGMCYKHNNSNAVFVYGELYDRSATIIADGSNDYFKKNGKFIKPSVAKKNNLNPYVQKCLGNDSLRKQVEEFCENLYHENTKTLKMSIGNFCLDFSASSASSPKSKEKEPDEPAKEEADEAELKEDDCTDEAEPDEDDDTAETEPEEDDDTAEPEEEDDTSEADCVEIKTTDGRLFFCDGEGTLYEPEEGSDDSARPFAKMIEVKYKASPFHHNDKYYIAAVEIEADGTKYWGCKLANKAYVFDENEDGLHDHIGWIKTKKGKQVLKLKGQKKEVPITIVSEDED